MDESILLSFSLDQVMVQNETNGTTSLEYISEILEETSYSILGQTFYVVQTSDQCDISQLETSVSSGLEISGINDMDQSVNLVNLRQFTSNPGSVSFEGLALQEAHCDLRTSAEVLNYANSTYFLTRQHRNDNLDNKNRNTVIHIARTLHEDTCLDSKKHDNDSSKVMIEEPDLEIVLQKGFVSHSFLDNKKTNIPKDDTKNKEKLWTCDHCPELVFTSKSTYNRHRQSEHKSAHKIYSCTECELAFHLASRLKTHMICVHLHYRPHKCHICSKTFSKLADMKKHVDTHTATKHYTCSTCKKQFIDASNLKRHNLKHTKDKPYRCPTCWRRYAQLSSLKKHRTKSAAAILGSCGDWAKGVRQYYCKMCGEMFKYKMLLIEHEKNHNEYVTKNSDLGRNVDALIQRILQEETNQAKADEIDGQAKTESLEQVYKNSVGIIIQKTKEEEPDTNNYEIELINEIDRLESLTEENADNSANGFNIHPDFLTDTHSPVIRDDNYYLPSGLTQSEANLQIIDATKELIDIPRGIKSEMTDSLVCEQADVDCATIFESDVDLESSVNLAANLNQLIAENTVDFVSTEHDDTFIINLNSAIDAEQLSNLLNIEIEIVENRKENEAPLKDKIDVMMTAKRDLLVQKIPSRIKKRPKLYNCTVCLKVFNRKNNYTSHMGIHNIMLSHHKCEVCHQRFGYRSTLNKHMLAVHTPAVLPTHQCNICGKKYRYQWMVRDHTDRVHRKLAPYRCLVVDCGKQYYKRSDFLYHCRQHVGERPYRCAVCGVGFTHASHRTRHARRCPTSTPKRGTAKSTKQSQIGSTEMSKELLSDINDLLA